MLNASLFPLFSHDGEKQSKRGQVRAMVRVEKAYVRWNSFSGRGRGRKRKEREVRQIKRENKREGEVKKRRDGTNA